MQRLYKMRPTKLVMARRRSLSWPYFNIAVIQ